MAVLFDSVDLTDVDLDDVSLSEDARKQAAQELNDLQFQQEKAQDNLRKKLEKVICSVYSWDYAVFECILYSLWQLWKHIVM